MKCIFNKKKFCHSNACSIAIIQCSEYYARFFTIEGSIRIRYAMNNKQYIGKMCVKQNLYSLKMNHKQWVKMRVTNLRRAHLTKPFLLDLIAGIECKNDHNLAIIKSRMAILLSGPTTMQCVCVVVPSVIYLENYKHRIHMKPNEIDEDRRSDRQDRHANTYDQGVKFHIRIDLKLDLHQRQYLTQYV